MAVLQLFKSLSRAHGPALLEALPAKYRSPLRWAERHGSFFAALRAVGFCFRTHLQGGSVSSNTFGTSRLATFTSLWFVLETFIREKHLFAGRKYKLGAALRTLQDPVVVFHGAPLAPKKGQGMGLLAPRAWTTWKIPLRGRAGITGYRAGSQGPASVKPVYPTVCLNRGLILGSAAPSKYRKR